MINQTIEQELADIILEVGVPPNITGYKFLREAIIDVVKDQNLATSITKGLYPLVAEKFDTSSNKVERSIRHAIEVAYNSGKILNLNTRFGLQIFGKYDKPSNGQLIALIADRLIIENFHELYQKGYVK